MYPPFLIDFVYPLRCIKAQFIKELQLKLVDLHMKLDQVAELNTALKATLEIRESFNGFN